MGNHLKSLKLCLCVRSKVVSWFNSIFWKSTKIYQLVFYKPTFKQQIHVTFNSNHKWITQFCSLMSYYRQIKHRIYLSREVLLPIKSKLQFYGKKEGKSQTDLEDSLQEKNIEEIFIQWQQELLFQFNVAIQVLSKHTSNITKTRSQVLDEYFSLLKAVIKDLKYDKPLGTS